MKLDDGFIESEKMLNELEAKIKKEYLQAYKEMDEKVQNYYAKFKKQDGEQRAKYEAGEIKKKDYTEWRLRKMATGKQYSQMRNTLVSDLTKTAQIAMKYVDDKAIDVYALNMNYGTYLIEHETEIDTTFTLYNHDAVQRLIKDNPELLPQPKVDIDKSERWNLQHLQSAITQGILQGESIAKIAKRMQRVANMERSAAIRNARTAMTGAQNGGRLDSMKRAQERGIEVKKGWLATLDGRTRDSHAVMDGEEVEMNETFSNGLMFPGDANGAPSEVYNCRCRMVHVFPKYRTDWSNMENRNTDNLGDMSYEEWKNKHKERLEKKMAAKSAVEASKEVVKPKIKDEHYEKVVENIKKDYNILYKDVEYLDRKLTDEEIIEKLAGGDMTQGSCSSLAFCYIGNRCGYDVTDFRGGQSQEFFSHNFNIKEIEQFNGVKYREIKTQKEASDLAKALKEMNLEHGKEYRLTCGRHAAIIRNTENGYEYLELQSSRKNGWMPFEYTREYTFLGETRKEKHTMAETLQKRFGCRKTADKIKFSDKTIIFEKTATLTEVDSYKGNEDFKDILGYINTAPDKQKKGVSGHER